MGSYTVKMKNGVRNFSGNPVLGGEEIHSVAKTVAGAEQR